MVEVAAEVASRSSLCRREPWHEICGQVAGLHHHRLAMYQQTLASQRPTRERSKGGTTGVLRRVHSRGAECARLGHEFPICRGSTRDENASCVQCSSDPAAQLTAYVHVRVLAAARRTSTVLCLVAGRSPRVGVLGNPRVRRLDHRRVHRGWYSPVVGTRREVVGASSLIGLCTQTSDPVRDCHAAAQSRFVDAWV